MRRGELIHDTNEGGCVQQSENGDKVVDTRKVFAVLQEISRSRKRTRERERGRRLMSDCRDRGGNVVTGNIC